MAVGLSFDGYDLQNANVVTTIHGMDSYPERHVDVQRLARTDGSKLVNSNFGARVIPIEGYVVGSTLADLESRLDTLRQNLRGQDKNLDIAYNSGTRRFVATARNLIISRENRAVSIAIFSVEFICPEPAGKETSQSTLLSSQVITTATSNQAVTVAGNTDQLPVVTVVINSGGGMAGKYVKVTNPDTGQFIKVERTWLAADALVVNFAAKTVKVNGNLVDFTGAMTSWAPGSQTIAYEDNFTSRNVTINATYFKRFL